MGSELAVRPHDVICYHRNGLTKIDIVIIRYSPRFQASEEPFYQAIIPAIQTLFYLIFPQ